MGYARSGTAVSDRHAIPLVWDKSPAASDSHRLASDTGWASGLVDTRWDASGIPPATAGSAVVVKGNDTAAVTPDTVAEPTGDTLAGRRKADTPARSLCTAAHASAVGTAADASGTVVDA